MTDEGSSTGNYRVHK